MSFWLFERMLILRFIVHTGTLLVVFDWRFTWNDPSYTFQTWKYMCVIIDGVMTPDLCIQNTPFWLFERRLILHYAYRYTSSRFWLKRICMKCSKIYFFQFWKYMCIMHRWSHGSFGCAVVDYHEAVNVTSIFSFKKYFD